MKRIIGLLTTCLTLGLSVFGEGLTLSGTVSDSTTRVPISQATVSLVGGQAVHDETTDVKGNFILHLVSNVKRGDIVRLRVSKAGYQIYDEQISVAAELPTPISLVPNASANGPKTTPKPAGSPQTKDQQQPPVFLKIEGKDSWISYSYIEGGAVEIGPGARGIDFEHNVIDAAPWLEHLEKIRRSEANDLTKPHFSGQVSKVYVVGSPMGELNLFIYVEVSNKGQSSAIKNWRMDYQDKESVGFINAHPVLLDTTIHEFNGRVWNTVSILDSTPEITAGKELSKDGTAHGWIQVHVPSDLTADFKENRGRFVLVCQDNIGTDYALKTATKSQ